MAVGSRHVQLGDVAGPLIYGQKEGKRKKKKRKKKLDSRRETAASARPIEGLSATRR